MKTLDQIAEDLCAPEAIGKPVELTLHRGFKLHYDLHTGTIRLKPAKELKFDMTPPTVTVKLREFMKTEDRRFWELKFENYGYTLHLNCADIADYRRV